MTRQKKFILVILLLLAILGGGILFFYRNYHAMPFWGDGEKRAVLFRDYGDYKVHDLEYIGITKVTIEGEMKHPLFQTENFTGTIEIDYFCEQKILKHFTAKNVHVEEKNGIKRVAIYQNLLSSNGKTLAGFPVDLRLFFGEGMPNEILKVSWERRGDYIYWMVCGVEDEGKARKILEDFFAWPKGDVLDVLFY